MQSLPTDAIKPRGQPSSSVPWQFILEKSTQIHCSVYKQYPRAYTGIIKSPLSKLNKAVMDGLCGDDPNGLPPPPQQQFTGGQCCEKFYQCNWQLTQTLNGSVSNGVAQRSGAVGAISLSDRGNGTWSIGYSHTTCDGTEGRVNMAFGSLAFVQGYRVDSFVVTSLSGADDCGNPEPQYPDRGGIPDGTFPPDIVVPSPDGTNINVPVVLAPVLINGALSFDVGGINVQVGPFDTNINIGGNGNGNPTAPSPLPFDPIPELDNISDDLDKLADDVLDIKDIVDILPRDIPPCPETDLQPVLNAIASMQLDVDTALTKLEEILQGIGDLNIKVSDIQGDVSTILELVSKIPNVQTARVTLTKLPSQGKQQWGGGTGKDLAYAGWFSFTLGSIPYPRMPIHYDDQLYIMYGDADGINYTFTNGSEGVATLIN